MIVSSKYNETLFSLLEGWETNYTFRKIIQSRDNKQHLCCNLPTICCKLRSYSYIHCKMETTCVWDLSNICQSFSTRDCGVIQRSGNLIIYH